MKFSNQFFACLAILFSIVPCNAEVTPEECSAYLQECLLHNGSCVRACLFVPDDQVKKALVALIDAERHSIKAALFRFTDPDLAQALVRALERGVLLELVVDKSCVIDKYEKLTALSAYNVPVHVYKGYFSIMHHKFWIFSNNIFGGPLVWTGSVNATAVGTMRNAENALLLDDAIIITRYQEQFEILKGRIIAAGDKYISSKPRNGELGIDDYPLEDFCME